MFARIFTLIAIIAAAISVKAVCDSGVPGDTYIVTSGDTCWGIATEAGIDVAQFEEANPDIKCNFLVVGQRVCVLTNVTVPGEL